MIVLFNWWKIDLQLFLSELTEGKMSLVNEMQIVQWQSTCKEAVH